MQQLGLTLDNRLPYVGKDFFVHAGVSAVVNLIKGSYGVEGFSSLFIFGSSRSGKTHLSLYAGEVLAQGRVPKYLEGSHFKNWMSSVEHSILWSDLDVIIIDDIDRYFLELKEGESGPFVNFYESLKRSRAKLTMFSSTPWDKFPCDPHVMSRLKASGLIDLTPPSEEDIPTLVSRLGRQRGFKLKDRQIDFISKRVRRDLPSLERYFDRVHHLSGLLGSKVKFPLLNDAV